MANSVVDINPATAASGQIPIATYVDTSGDQHQRMVMETQNSTSDPVAVGTSNPLPVAISSGAVPGSSDQSTFTAGTTQGVPVLGVYNDSIGTLSSGVQAVPRLSMNRQTQVALGASQTDGWTMATYVAPATPAVVQLKASSGKLGVIAATNNGSTWVYLKIWDAASAPTLGTTTPNWNIGIPPAGGNNPPLVGGIQFANGIYYSVTGGAALLDDTSVTASAAQVNFGWQ